MERFLQQMGEQSRGAPTNEGRPLIARRPPRPIRRREGGEEILWTWQEELSGGLDQSTAVGWRAVIVADYFWSGAVAWSRHGLWSFAVAHRGGGGRAARVVGPWISERGFESHRGG